MSAVANFRSCFSLEDSSGEVLLGISLGDEDATPRIGRSRGSRQWEYKHQGFLNSWMFQRLKISRAQGRKYLSR